MHCMTQMTVITLTSFDLASLPLLVDLVHKLFLLLQVSRRKLRSRTLLCVVTFVATVSTYHEAETDSVSYLNLTCQKYDMLQVQASSSSRPVPPLIFAFRTKNERTKVEIKGVGHVSGTSFRASKFFPFEDKGGGTRKWNIFSCLKIFPLRG